MCAVQLPVCEPSWQNLLGCKGEKVITVFAMPKADPLYRISFTIERDEIVPIEVFKRLISRPCRDLDLHGRLRKQSDYAYDAIVEGPRDKVERYLEYLRVGESIIGLLHDVVRYGYINTYGLGANFLYVDFEKKRKRM